MTDAAIPDRPGFHLVEPSPWPIVGAAFAFLIGVWPHIVDARVEFRPGDF